MSERSAAKTIPLLVADIYDAAGALRQRGDRIAAIAGQTQARWQVLSVLSEGDWTVPNIARRLGVTRQAVQRTADQLSRDGSIEFEANPNHERSPFARPTPAGLTALAATTAAASDWNEHAATELKASDLDIARSVLQTLSTAAVKPLRSLGTSAR
jgi:DNA-binding MarR family transcriptional regulator